MQKNSRRRLDDEMSPHPRSDVRTGPPEENVRAVGDRVLSVLGQQSWLDRPGYRLEHALGFVLAACGSAGERIGNLLHGTWLGHPLHPLVVALPTGAVATTVALDVAAVLPGTSRGCGRRPGSASVSGSSPAWLRQRRV